MKIAIPTERGELCSHFGHCEAFALFTVENGKIVKEEMVDPPVHQPGSHPEFLRNLGCDLVIAGGMGMKAQELFSMNSIKTVVSIDTKPLREIIADYLKGDLKEGENRCDH